jgi:hypothetical protein
MVNVNRNELPPKEISLLLKRFDVTLSKLKATDTTLFLNDLLGKEERLTIAKRLAAIVLIAEGCSAYRASLLLKLSPTTTGIIAANIQAGIYSNLIQRLKKGKRDYLEILETIDSILLLGGLLPRRVGLDRYRELNKAFGTSQRKTTNRRHGSTEE